MLELEGLMAQVRAYLRDCEGSPGLSRVYHPTEAGVLKMIYHRNDAEAGQIRWAYGRIVSRRSQP
jgi:hypothetical protein